MFYSKKTNGFYVEEIHGDNMPADVVEITEEQHTALMDGQSLGKTITGDSRGYPILIDAPVVEPSYAEKRAAEYPSMNEYLDGIVKGDQAQVNAYIAACLAVKNKYPKPSQGGV